MNGHSFITQYAYATLLYRVKTRIMLNLGVAKNNNLSTIYGGSLTSLTAPVVERLFK
jgi:hypothetical protein